MSVGITLKGRSKISDETPNTQGIDRSLTPMSEDVAHCVSELNKAIDELLELLCKIIATVMELPGSPTLTEKPDPRITSVVVPLIQSAGSSIAAMQAFPLPGLRTRECYLMARAVVETLVNTCYVLAKGLEAADAAKRHAKQKAFRDLSRQSEIAGHRINMGLKETPNIDELEGLAKDLERFTTNSGKEDYRWTKDNLDERIGIAGEAFGPSVLSRLHMARFAVYRHSSEIIHGTLFGYLYFHGSTLPSEPASSQEGLAQHIADQHIYLLLSVVLASSAFIKSFHKKYGISDINTATTDLDNRVREIPYLKSERDQNDD